VDVWKIQPNLFKTKEILVFSFNTENGDSRNANHWNSKEVVSFEIEGQ
jgi:hypothetical protein